MKFKILFSFLFLCTISLFSQTTLEKELERIKQDPNIKLSYLEDNKILIDYGNHNTRIFDLKGIAKKRDNENDSVPHFTFDLFQMDTSLFKHRFIFQQQLPIGAIHRVPLIGDINNNGKVEYYGVKKGLYTDLSEVFCYEQNGAGLFTETYKYPSNTFSAYNIYDIDRDGEPELHLTAFHLDTNTTYIIDDQRFFKKSAEDSLAIQPYFDYNIYPGYGGFYIQLNDITFGDFDKDSITEAVFYNFAPQSIYLTKFNHSSLTFDSLMAYATPENEEVAGFVIGDFDMDEKTDIIYSGVYGNIYVLENRGINQYEISWQGNTGIPNSYINFQTNDIDGNNKPEFWIAGQSFPDNLTKLICYEMDDNDSYHEVAEIEFPGVLSLFTQYGQGVDVDNDGKDEIYLQCGNTIAILKYIGTPGNPKYQIYYFLQTAYQTESSRIYQFPNEKYPSIIISMTRYNSGKSELLSWILKHYLITDLNGKGSTSEKIEGYQLFNNYPNPFNPSTTIKFLIPERSGVIIKVFNSLGEEIITLINNTLERGEHQITWNGIDESNQLVPSGVYFISMEANRFQKIIKCVLIK